MVFRSSCPFAAALMAAAAVGLGGGWLSAQQVHWAQPQHGTYFSVVGDVDADGVADLLSADK